MNDTITAQLSGAVLDEIEEQARDGCYANPEDAISLVAMARRAERLEAVLVRVQFCVPVQLSHGDHQVACPVCSKLKKSGHRSTCAIAAALTPAQEAINDEDIPYQNARQVCLMVPEKEYEVLVAMARRVEGLEALVRNTRGSVDSMLDVLDASFAGWDAKMTLDRQMRETLDRLDAALTPAQEATDG